MDLFTESQDDQIPLPTVTEYPFLWRIPKHFTERAKFSNKDSRGCTCLQEEWTLSCLRFTQQNFTCNIPCQELAVLHQQCCTTIFRKRIQITSLIEIEPTHWWIREHMCCYATRVMGQARMGTWVANKSMPPVDSCTEIKVEFPGDKTQPRWYFRVKYLIFIVFQDKRISI